ncbi:MAG: hypothetical protein ACOX0W_02110 [Sphaerochaetaceae bacterium]
MKRVFNYLEVLLSHTSSLNIPLGSYCVPLGSVLWFFWNVLVLLSSEKK